MKETVEEEERGVLEEGKGWKYLLIDKNPGVETEKREEKVTIDTTEDE